MTPMWLLWCTTALAAPHELRLPPGAVAAEWTEALALAGLAQGNGGEGAWIELIDRGATWTVRAHREGGGVVEETLPAPRTPGAREDVALLCASLLRPLGALARPEPPVVAPPAVVVPAPALRPPAAQPPPRPAGPAAGALSPATVAPLPVAPASPSTPAAAPPIAPAPAPAPEAPPPPPPTVAPPPPAPLAEAVTVVPPPPATSWEIDAGIGVGLRVDAAASPLLHAGVRRRRGDFSFGLGAAGETPAAITGLDATPTVGSFSLSALGQWEPASASGLTVGAELGLGLLFLSDAAGAPLHEAVGLPRLAATLGWTSPGVAGVAVEPYARVAVVLGEVELQSARNGDRLLSPVLADVGIIVRFRNESQSETRSFPGR